MRMIQWSLLPCGLALALLSGCEAYVHTDAPGTGPRRCECEAAGTRG